MKWFLVSAIISVYLYVFAVPVRAAEPWVIEDFSSQIIIQADGKVDVVETITVDFGQEEKHGIYRDIPYIYTTEEDTELYTDMDVRAVKQDGATARYTASKQGKYLRLKIGDADTVISGTHTYQIHYVAIGVLRSFGNQDELYWDVTGNGWPVPINKVNATVQFPIGGITQVACYQGEQGAIEPCTSEKESDRQAAFTAARPLAEGEGLTVVVGYPTGLVPILEVSRSAATGIPDAGLSLSIFLLGSAAVVWLWWKNGRERRSGSQTVMVEYFPPNTLRPAEVGTLLDERADTLDVTATIIDLAARGFLTITEQPKSWLFGNTDYALLRVAKETSSLRAYEKKLLDKLFADKELIKMSELKHTFYADLAEVKESLYAEVVKKKFFTSNPETVRGIYTGIAIALLIIGIVGVFSGIGAANSMISSLSVGVAGTGLVLLLFSRSFSRRTAHGYELFRKVMGFKLFVDKVETYKQQMMERENLFNEVLPYAIVFGATEKFAKAFADLGIKPPQPTWYFSSRPFNPVLFSSDINSFSSSMTSAIASQPAKNSFASSGSGFSGGSSGGGFGGGGGGSW